MSTTSPAAAPSLARVAFADFDHEMATTRRVLERVPEDQFSWKPHEKSFSLGDLATHVGNIPMWLTMTVNTDELDAAGPMPDRPTITTREELLAFFDGNVADAREALGRVDDAMLAQSWTMRRGDHVIFSQPKAGVIRGFVLSHLIHHRAQLAVYLRLLDVPVPSIYGPSADENPF